MNIQTAQIMDRIQQLNCSLHDFTEYVDLVYPVATTKHDTRISVHDALVMMARSNSTAEELRNIFLGLMFNQSLKPEQAYAAIHAALEETAAQWSEEDQFAFHMLQ